MSLEGGKNSPPGTEIIITNKGIIPAGGSEHTLTERRILKDELTIISFWFGRRLCDYSDLSAYNGALGMYRAFPLKARFDVPQIEDIEEEGNHSLLTLVGQDLVRELKAAKGPLVTFVILPGTLIEDPRLERFPQNLREYRKKQGRSDAFVYKLIVGGETYGNLPKGVQGNISERFWRHELQALEHGGIYLCYENDYYTRSSKRILELMNRLVGADLPGEEFPNYSLADAARIAWHVNREDFTLLHSEPVHFPNIQL